MHFETIWNEAESVSKSFTNLDRKQILRWVRDGLDNLTDSEKPDELNEAMGEILFGLCAFCAYLEEKQNIEINSAVALQQAINHNRQQLLDPER